MRKPMMWMSRFTAPVDPDPTGSTTSSEAAFTYVAMRWNDRS